MVVMDGEPSGAQHPTPDREGNPQCSLSDHHLGGSTPSQLQANLGDFVDIELQQVMEDLCREVTLRVECTPQRPTTNTFGKSCGKWGS